jgi:hypothetical protein
MGKTENTIRCQIYKYDMGMYHKAYIQHITKEEMEEMNKSLYRKAFPLPADDLYGNTLPNKFE